MTFTIYNSKRQEINSFSSKEKFIDGTIDILKECTEQYRMDFDHEAEKLGFNLTEYVEIAEDEWEGGEIIRDDDCYNACIRFWEEYGDKCTVKVGE